MRSDKCDLHSCPTVKCRLYGIGCAFFCFFITFLWEGWKGGFFLEKKKKEMGEVD